MVKLVKYPEKPKDAMALNIRNGINSDSGLSKLRVYHKYARTVR